MSSSDSDNPFGQESEEEIQDQDLDLENPPPDYIDSKEFKDFQNAQLVNYSPQYGYIYVHTYKPFYFPGEIIRGSIILDFFNDLPKKNKKVMLRFKGGEDVGKHYENVKREMMRT